MKLLITGGKHFPHRYWIDELIERVAPDTIVVTTGAKYGVEAWACEAASLRGLPAPAMICNKSMGGDTNDYWQAQRKIQIEVVELSDVVVAFWDGNDLNARDILGQASKHGIPSFVVSGKMSGWPAVRDCVVDYLAKLSKEKE